MAKKITRARKTTRKASAASAINLELTGLSLLHHELRKEVDELKARVDALEQQRAVTTAPPESAPADAQP